MKYRNKISGNIVDAFKFTDSEDYPEFFISGINDGTILVEYREDGSKFCEINDEITVNSGNNYILQHDFGITSMDVYDFEKIYERS